MTPVARMSGNALSNSMRSVNYIPLAALDVNYLVVAGGGGGETATGGRSGGGGGGGNSSGGSGVVILRWSTTAGTISIGSGLTADAVQTVGSDSYVKITAGTGNVSWS